MKWKSYLHRALSTPPHKLMFKLGKRMKKSLDHLNRRQKDTECSTLTESLSAPFKELQGYINHEFIDALPSELENLSSVSEAYISHCFNLLGSGWLRVRHAVVCKGTEGFRYEMAPGVQMDEGGDWLKQRINDANVTEAQQRWRLIQDDYSPIDWHLDFKSGFRWPENTWYLDIQHGHKPGVDIKVPWELARMQHLPQLALAYGLSKKQPGRCDSQDKHLREFRNQIVDFIATNPPRFGVNWRCPMDVGIRAVNWLVAYDLFQGFGGVFDDPFEKEFFRSIYQHGRHIVNNLEWNDSLRANHYLSNVASLLFIAAYLPCLPEVDTWLAFSIQELISEVEAQFHTEGSNFEASTSYHRLSTEVVVYATALILRLPKNKKASLEDYDQQAHRGVPKSKSAPIELYPLEGTKEFTPFPDWYIERLEKMAEFSMNITKPNGHIPQIGDNDSGRFLKLQPVFQTLKVAEAKAFYTNLKNYDEFPRDASFWEEDFLDHRHLVAAINGLFNRTDFAEFVGPGWIETGIVENLCKGIRFPSRENPGNSWVGNKRFNESSDDIRCFSYPDFGLYVYRSKDLYLAVRCGSVGQNGNGGHSHNDQLSFELNIHGRDFIVDGGSFLYTPMPHIRNEFRSTRAHNTLFLQGFEQNSWEEGLGGLFCLKDKGRYGILNCNNRYFKGEFIRDSIRHVRSFELGNNHITIEDHLSADSFGELNFNLAPETEIMQIIERDCEEYFLQLRNRGVSLGLLLTGFRNVEVTEGFYSNGYGSRIRNQRLRCDRSRFQTLVRLIFD